MIRRRTALAGLAGFMTAGHASAQAAWPAQPVTITVPFSPGGSADLLARLVAEHAAPALGGGARVVVENRAGAGGTIGANHVRRQQPDGYSLLLATPSTHGTVPAIQPDVVGYHPVNDFAPIAIMGRAPLALAVPTNSPHRDAASLIAWIRANPGRASWGSSGVGSIGHLTGELMNLLGNGLQAEHIPYRGGADVAAALAGGQITYAWEPIASLSPGFGAGHFRGIAVSTPARHPGFRDIGTMQEAGLSGFETSTWNVLVGPAGLPTALAQRINRAVNSALAVPAVRDRLGTAGVDAVSDSTTESTRAFLASQFATYQDVVRRANLRPAG
jgi:tripartite-type tricarboxylate transporter receptor subunit TctC